MRRLVASVAIAAVLVFAAPRPAVADDIRDREWHLSALGIAAAQQISQGEGVVVAVLDTGVDAKHGELASAVLPGKGFGEGNDTDGRVDFLGHGTAMAGLIAGRGLPGGSGVLGVAPKAMILPVQVLRNELGLGDPAVLAQGIDWAVVHGAKVINLSLGNSEAADVEEAIERAMRAGVVVVAAAGNAPDRQGVDFPAKVPGVIAVGGTDRNGDHAEVSVTGPEMVVAAPAVDIVSTQPSGKYGLGKGTSDATAIVSGVVALVRAKYPALSAPEVIRRITSTATDKGQPGRDSEYGFGIVNPVAALTAALPPPSSPAAEPQTPPSHPTRPPLRPPAAAAAAGAVVVLVIVAGLLLWRSRRARG